MYLSRVKINRSIRTSMKFLGSLQVIHATIAGCFPPEDTSRKLWRLDYLHGEPYLLVLSQNKPNFTKLVEQFGYLGDTGETRDCQNLFAALKMGHHYRFRFCGNPVHSKKTAGSKGRGTIVPHVTAAQQEEWFCRKSEQAGFSIDSMTIVQRDIRKFSRQGKTVTLHTATFEGILQITDVEKFRQSICTGIGRAKAYGCGLLTLARL
ncbi:type I-E CRISPR-associated protein Cas6/Cse3/CasE [uncultured Mitsuokella sp.]|uniref:type I-E CRISPR-associated protein Cas6/Cse3/CasE n=1 Tax=uncultured Mitsuokella sp. TaxID=453120 RepID=UPI0025E44EFA|nr:type I-E CRISPR-associated protein Cas6/Cse3/CasE [uncultured Mitsuokella sp.]